MKTFISAIGHAAAAGAMVLALSSGAFAQGKAIQVRGIAFQGVGANEVGRAAGPNYIVSRDLQLAILPCDIPFDVPFCDGVGNGFMGKVVVSPESVQRLDKNGAWKFHMLAKQTIQAGEVDFGPGQAPFPFPDAYVVVDGAFYYGCRIDQTLVATGDLTKPGEEPLGFPAVTGIDNSYAKNVYATWTINSGSTCTSPTTQERVKVTGHGSLVFDPANFVFVPSYDGTIRISK